MAPLDASGFTASVVGTILCALAFVGTLIWGQAGYWPHIFATGTVLGLCLMCYTIWHRQHAKKKVEADQTADGQD